MGVEKGLDTGMNWISSLFHIKTSPSDPDSPLYSWKNKFLRKQSRQSPFFLLALGRC